MIQLDHFNITAPMEILIRVRDFYQTVLGLTEGNRPHFARRGFWLYGNGRPIVHLIEGDTGEQQPATTYLDHIAFHTDDLRPIKERLDSLGIACEQVLVPGGAIEQLIFYDPVGIKVEVNASI
ncbi:VOC family protein [Microbulbifer sp. 2304DJ12-6]|uniref:VOC family protein n=1 Tax=Microbulbifer sp. 2304DJ12-6 TaxID=3233340 RepID=UPI0039AFA28A